MAHSNRTIADFYQNVVIGKEDEHWHWIGETENGVAWWKGRPAAYTAWEIRYSLDRMTMELIQDCGDGLCVNPRHLKDSGRPLKRVRVKKSGSAVSEGDSSAVDDKIQE